MFKLARGCCAGVRWRAGVALSAVLIVVTHEARERRAAGSGALSHITPASEGRIANRSLCNYTRQAGCVRLDAEAL